MLYDNTSPINPILLKYLYDVTPEEIMTINSIHFWNEPVECLRKLRMLLRPGGLIAARA